MTKKRKLRKYAHFNDLLLLFFFLPNGAMRSEMHKRKTDVQKFKISNKYLFVPFFRIGLSIRSILH